MPSETYELISLGMRYWFVLLGVVIVLRAARWALQDHRTYMRTLRALPDAGLIGEIVNLETGESQPLPREGVIGSGKACDVRFVGLRRRELEYYFRDGIGVAVVPSHRRHQILLDGDAIHGRAYALHGSRLSMPGYFLRMRLFAGLNLPDLSAELANAPLDASTDTQSGFNMEDLAGYGSLAPSIMADAPLEMPATVYPQPGEARPEHLDAERTWIYAVPPPEVFQQPWSHEVTANPSESQAPIETRPSKRAGRRSKRHEK